VAAALIAMCSVTAHALDAEAIAVRLQELDTQLRGQSATAAEVLETLREQYPDLAHLPAIPLSVKSAESTAERASVLQYMPRSPVAEAYREVGAWLEMTPITVGRR